MIFNRPLELKLMHLFEGMKIKGLDVEDGNVFLGGRVNPGAIFILHSADKSWKNTLQVSKNINMTTDYEAIEDIARGESPENFILTLGIIRAEDLSN